MLRRSRCVQIFLQTIIIHENNPAVNNWSIRIPLGHSIIQVVLILSVHFCTNKGRINNIEQDGYKSALNSTPNGSSISFDCWLAKPVERCTNLLSLFPVEQTTSGIGHRVKYSILIVLLGWQPIIR